MKCMAFVTRALMTLSVSLIALASTGCATKKETAQVIGGGLGLAVGYHAGGARALPTVVGGLVGYALGGWIGKSMDDSDRLRAQNALENNRDGRPSTWTNPNTGKTYSVTPSNTTDGVNPCRTYTVQAAVAGEQGARNVTGIACRNNRGEWVAKS